MADVPALRRVEMVKDNATASKVIKDATCECKADLTVRRHRCAALVVRS